MKENLIELETAKLAKEKGFDVPCWDYFLQDDFENCSHNRENHNLMNDVYSRPSQSLLQKWLRKEKFISVLVEHGRMPNESFGYFTRIYTDTRKSSSQFKVFEYCDTYENALEEGLKVALNLL